MTAFTTPYSINRQPIRARVRFAEGVPSNAYIYFTFVFIAFFPVTKLYSGLSTAFYGVFRGG